MKANLISIDPGTTMSAYCIFEDGVPVRFGKVDNEELRLLLITYRTFKGNCVCERIRGYGMVVGKEVFQTCEWSGRFQESWLAGCGNSTEWHWLDRKDVKLNLCRSPKAKDANIRQAVIDRFGGKDKAIGKKSQPGVLYGASADVWSAIAIGLTWMDLAALESGEQGIRSSDAA